MLPPVPGGDGLRMFGMIVGLVGGVVGGVVVGVLDVEPGVDEPGVVVGVVHVGDGGT